MAKVDSTNRIFEVDILRGFAIVLMVIFHFCYDLSVFGWTDYDTGIDMEWRVFRALILSVFLLAVGMSSYLAYSEKVKIKKLLKNVGKLFAASILISATTMYLYPHSWVYFGVIHFITLALIVAVLFVRIPNIALFVGIVIIVGHLANAINLTSLWLWAIEHLAIPERTVDLVSFTPWIGLVLIGIYLMHHNLFSLSIKQNRLSQFLSMLGKHSLIIYLLHQLILFAGFSLFEWLLV